MVLLLMLMLANEAVLDVKGLIIRVLSFLGLFVALVIDRREYSFFWSDERVSSPSNSSPVNRILQPTKLDGHRTNRSKQSPPHGEVWAVI